MRRISSVLGLISVSFLAAQAGQGKFQALLQSIPPLPTTADQAYGQWTDANGGLQEGPGFTGLEQALKTATETLPGRQAPSAATNALVQHYSTPEGQAEIKNMSMAQKMALAQQMAAASAPAPAGPSAVTPHDAALIRLVAGQPPDPTAPAKLMQVINAKIQLDAAWQKADQDLETQESADERKLPICQGEAGEPSSLSLRNLMRSYAPKHAMLAQTMLAKYAPLYAQLRATLAPEIANADNAVAAWNQIAAPNMKQQMAPASAGAGARAIQDIIRIDEFAQDTSKRAAQIIARKNVLEKNFANARGC